jgi:hypothetical protein
VTVIIPGPPPFGQADTLQAKAAVKGWVEGFKPRGTAAP